MIGVVAIKSLLSLAAGLGLFSFLHHFDGKAPNQEPPAIVYDQPTTSRASVSRGKDTCGLNFKDALESYCEDEAVSYKVSW